MCSSNIVRKVSKWDHHRIAQETGSNLQCPHYFYQAASTTWSLWEIQTLCPCFVYALLPWKAILSPLTLSFLFGEYWSLPALYFSWSTANTLTFLFISFFLSRIFFPEWSIKDLVVILWILSEPLIDLTGLPTPIPLWGNFFHNGHCFNSVFSNPTQDCSAFTRKR